MKHYKNLNETQLRWGHLLILYEEARWVCRTFNTLINEIYSQILALLILRPDTDSEEQFLGYCYDVESKTCVRTDDETLYHPIYLKLDYSPDETYDAYVPTRVIGNVPEYDLLHDAIVVHINTARINLRNPQAKTRLGISLRHEFTHVKDMWSSEFENAIDTLEDLGYNGATREFFDEVGLKCSDEVIKTIAAMMTYISPAESEARLNAFDTFIMSVPEHYINTCIGDAGLSEEERINRFIMHNKYISGIQFIPSDNEYNRYMKDVNSHGDFTIPVLFTMFLVYCGFLEDTSGHFADFEDTKKVLNRKLEPDEAMIDMFVEAFRLYELHHNEYIAKVRDIVADDLKERKFFENMKITYNTYFLNEDLEYADDTNGYEDIESGISYPDIILGNTDYIYESEAVRLFNIAMSQLTRHMWLPKEHSVIFESDSKFNNNQIF